MIVKLTTYGGKGRSITLYEAEDAKFHHAKDAITLSVNGEGRFETMYDGAEFEFIESGIVVEKYKVVEIDGKLCVEEG